MLMEAQGKQRQIWSSGGAVRLQNPGETDTQQGEGEQAGETLHHPSESLASLGWSGAVLHPPIVLQLYRIYLIHIINIHVHA